MVEIMPSLDRCLRSVSDAQLSLFSGSCRITVTGSNLNVSHSTKLLMSNGVDSFALNVMLLSLILSFIDDML